MIAAAQQCCSTSCPYIGYVHGIGMDIVLEYNWFCDLDVWTNPKDDKYRCAKDTLKYSSEVISTSSTIFRTSYIDTPGNVRDSSSTALVDHRRVHYNTGLRLRFEGTGICTELRGISFAEMTTLFASASFILLVSRVVLMTVLNRFKRAVQVPNNDTYIALRREGNSGAWRAVEVDREDKLTVQRLQTEIGGALKRVSSFKPARTATAMSPATAAAARRPVPFSQEWPHQAPEQFDQASEQYVSQLPSTYSHPALLPRPARAGSAPPLLLELQSQLEPAPRSWTPVPPPQTSTWAKGQRQQRQRVV